MNIEEKEQYVINKIRQCELIIETLVDEGRIVKNTGSNIKAKLNSIEKSIPSQLDFIEDLFSSLKETNVLPASHSASAAVVKALVGNIKTPAGTYSVQVIKTH